MMLRVPQMVEALLVMFQKEINNFEGCSIL